MNTYIENKRSISTTAATTNPKRAPLSSTTPKKSQFQDAVVAKSDVGEFQGGYFIMPSGNDEKMKRPIIPNQKFSPQRKRLPPVSQFNNQSIVIEEDIKAIKQQQQQQYQQLQKKQQLIHKQLQEQQMSNNNDDNNLLLTPASLKNNDYNSPSKPQYKQQYQNQNNNNQQQQQQQQKYLSPQPKYSTGSSPPRANSPNKKPITSPSQINCWAGGAFNNSPSPNSLPIPDFGDDSDLVSSISQPEPQPTLEQMSFDLRRLLNITPVAVAGSSN